MYPSRQRDCTRQDISLVLGERSAEGAPRTDARIPASLAAMRRRDRGKRRIERDKPRRNIMLRCIGSFAFVRAERTCARPPVETARCYPAGVTRNSRSSDGGADKKVWTRSQSDPRRRRADHRDRPQRAGCSRRIRPKIKN